MVTSIMMFFLQQTNIPSDFFTPASLGTLASCTTAVFVICSGIQKAFNYNPRWLALVVSIVVSMLGAFITEPSAKPETAIEAGKATESNSLNTGKEATKYIIAFINGFLIYASATGANQVFGNDSHRTPSGGSSGTANNRPEVRTEKKREFLSRWF